MVKVFYSLLQKTKSDEGALISIVNGLKVLSLLWNHVIRDVIRFMCKVVLYTKKLTLGCDEHFLFKLMVQPNNLTTIHLTYLTYV